MLSWLVHYLNVVGCDVIILLLVVIGLTLLQKYHYKLLFFLQKKTGGHGKYFFDFLIRVWVVIHEISHLVFAFLLWLKIRKINIWHPKGGQVELLSEDYIADLPFHNENKLFYWIKLIYNRISVFLTALWPLIIWYFLTNLIINLLYWREVRSFHTLSVSHFEISWLVGILFSVYLIFILPAFLLSFKDLSNLFFYKWENLVATVVWTAITTWLFAIVLITIAQRYTYFEVFMFLYVLVFVLLCLLSGLVRVLWHGVGHTKQ